MVETISAVSTCGADMPKNTSAPLTASASVPVMWPRLVTFAISSCAGLRRSSPSQTMPKRSTIVMSFTPRNIRNLVTAIAAAPQPLTTILISSTLRPVRRQALSSAAPQQTAVPCWSS